MSNLPSQVEDKIGTAKDMHGTMQISIIAHDQVIFRIKNYFNYDHQIFWCTGHFVHTTPVYIDHQIQIPLVMTLNLMIML